MSCREGPRGEGGAEFGRLKVRLEAGMLVELRIATLLPHRYATGLVAAGRAALARLGSIRRARRRGREHQNQGCRDKDAGRLSTGSFHGSLLGVRLL